MPAQLQSHNQTQKPEHKVHYQGGKATIICPKPSTNNAKKDWHGRERSGS